MKIKKVYIKELHDILNNHGFYYKKTTKEIVKGNKICGYLQSCGKTYKVKEIQDTGSGTVTLVTQYDEPIWSHKDIFIILED